MGLDEFTDGRGDLHVFAVAHQHLFDDFIGEPDTSGRVERIFRQFVLMDMLWPAHRLGYGDEEISGVFIVGRERFHED